MNFVEYFEEDLTKLYKAWNDYYRPMKMSYMKTLKLVHKKVNQRKAPPEMDIKKLIKQL